MAQAQQISPKRSDFTKNQQIGPKWPKFTKNQQTGRRWPKTTNQWKAATTVGGRGGAQTEETGQAVQTCPDEAHFQQLGPNTAKLDRGGT